MANRTIKIIIINFILTLKNATSASKLKKKISLLILTKKKLKTELKTKNHMNWDLSHKPRSKNTNPEIKIQKLRGCLVEEFK